MKGKLYRHLAALTQPEWKRFRLFAHSPYATQHEETVTLFDAMQRYYPDFRITDEKLFARAFPGKAFNYNRLRVLKTYLYKLIREFLMIEEMKKRPRIQETLLPLSLVNRNLLADAEKEVNEALHELKSMPLVNVDDAERVFSLEKRRVDIALRSRKGSPDYEALIKSLDIFSNSSRTQFWSAILSSGAMLKQNSKTIQIGEMLESINETNIKDVPVVGIYYFLLIILRSEDWEETQSAMKSLRKILDKSFREMKKSELINIYVMLCNKLFKESYRGIQGSRESLFEIYQIMVERELIFGMGAFSISMIKNILNLGIRLQKLAWVNDFLSSVKSNVPGEGGDVLFHHGMARIAYARKDYVRAKKSLLRIGVTDPNTRLQCDILLLRVYFELEETDPVFSLLSNLNRFLNRNNTFSNEHIAAYKNFLKLFKELFLTRNLSHKPSELQKIEGLISSTKPLMLSDWLLEKVRENGPVL